MRPYGEDFAKPKTEQEMSADRAEILERGIKNAKSVFQAGPWERMLFFAGGPAINFVAALVLFIIIALIGWPFVRADVTVYDIMPDSPAAAAGLQQGDIIVALDDQPVESADDFNDLITQQTDEPVNLLIERDGKQFDVSLTARAVESSDTERVYVTAIIEGMPAEGRLEVDDVIVKVDDLEVTSIEALRRIHPGPRERGNRRDRPARGGHGGHPHRAHRRLGRRRAGWASDRADQASHHRSDGCQPGRGRYTKGAPVGRGARGRRG